VEEPRPPVDPDYHFADGVVQFGCAGLLGFFFTLYFFLRWSRWSTDFVYHPLRYSLFSAASGAVVGGIYVWNGRRSSPGEGDD
jgi:hypothetical protein